MNPNLESSQAYPLSPRKYQTRKDGSIEYMDRKWFIEKLSFEKYINLLISLPEYKSELLTRVYKIRLITLSNNDLAAEYEDEIGGINLE